MNEWNYFSNDKTGCGAFSLTLFVSCSVCQVSIPPSCSDCPRTCDTDQAGLKLAESHLRPPPEEQIKGLK